MPSPLRVAFATIPEDQPGGIAATEHVFQAACARTGRLVPLTDPRALELRKRNGGAGGGRIRRDPSLMLDLLLSALPKHG